MLGIVDRRPGHLPLRRNAALLILLLLGFSLAWSVMPKILRAVVRNVAFWSIESQLLNGRSVAWGLGLREIARENVVVSLTKAATTQWHTDSLLGLAPFAGDSLVGRLGDCSSRRLVAQRAMREGDWEEARRLLAAVLMDCPKYSFVNIELGLVYDRLDNHAAAVAAFEAGGVSAFARYITAVDYLLLSRGCAPSSGVSDREHCTEWLERVLSLTPHNA